MRRLTEANDSRQKIAGFEEVSEALAYDPETGEFFRKNSKPTRSRSGDNADCIHSHSGYHIITPRVRKYRAHRLGWLIVFGEWGRK